MLRPIEVTLSFVPQVARRTRAAWDRLGRPVTVPQTPAEWRRLVDVMGPLQGPFDWALCMGPHRRSGSRRFTPLGNLVEAWRLYDYAEARTALSQLADELVQRAQGDLAFDILTELPHGFESGTSHTFMELVSDPRRVQSRFWDRRCASSYVTLPEHPQVAELALGVLVPVARKRVLLTALVFDRPDLASACVHRLRACGADWVGLLAISSETPVE